MVTLSQNDEGSKENENKNKKIQNYVDKQYIKSYCPLAMAPNWFVSISIMLELSIHTDTTG